MPSAQHREIEDPIAVTARQQRADIYSLLSAIRMLKMSSLHGRGRILFAEGEAAQGIYVLRTGRATVSISSCEGRLVMLRLARAGDVLGLNSVCEMVLTIRRSRRSNHVAQISFLARN